MSNQELAGKVAIVSGGASLIGAAIGRSLVEAGARVLLCYILEDLSAEVMVLPRSCSCSIHRKVL